jgi:hypothetical protein
MQTSVDLSWPFLSNAEAYSVSHSIYQISCAVTPDLALEQPAPLDLQEQVWSDDTLDGSVRASASSPRASQVVSGLDVAEITR